MGNESLTVEEIRQLAGDVDDFLHKIALTYRCDYTLLESAQNTLRKSKRNPDNMH